MIPQTFVIYENLKAMDVMYEAMLIERVKLSFQNIHYIDYTTAAANLELAIVKELIN